jgi:hypothetical protein
MIAPSMPKAPVTVALAATKRSQHLVVLFQSAFGFPSCRSSYSRKPIIDGFFVRANLSQIANVSAI